jgi:hypothetical protein
MACEKKRGCGFRKVGGLYLCGEYINVPCDRLPYELTSCPICGAGIKPSRGITEINPFKLFGNHDDGGRDNIIGRLTLSEDPNSGAVIGSEIINHRPQRCTDKIRPCLMCDPPDGVAYVMTVGKRHYTPQSFMQEAVEDGVSKRIPFIPKKMKLGETPVYLAHPEAVNGIKKPSEQGELLGNGQARLVDADKVEKRFGIFCVFIPQRIEMPIYKSRLTKKKRAELEKRGITPVVIKDGDKDHQ